MGWSSHSLAESVIQAVKDRSSLEADVVVNCANSTAVQYRMLNLEEVIEASRTCISLRVFSGKRQAVVSIDNIDNLDQIVDRARTMVESVPEDKNVTMPERSLMATTTAGFKLCDPTRPSIEDLKAKAKTLEEAALGYQGVDNSEGSSFSYSVVSKAFASTNGVSLEYQKSVHSCSVCVVAKSVKSGGMERWYDYSVALFAADLDSQFEKLAKTAAETAVKRLDPIKVDSVRVPIVFAPSAAEGLLGELAGLFSGSGIYSKSSFLCDLLGEKLFSDSLCIIDDPLAAKGCQSTPFDGEGVATQKTYLVDKGVVNEWLLDCYSATKLGMQSNGKCVRSSEGRIYPNYTNLYIPAGDTSEADLIKGIKNGFYVIDTMGFGLNPVTGDYSKGASGFWIENGELSYPVSEVTVAGNLREMFAACVTADNLSLCHSVNSPTLLLGEMMVSGK